MLNIKKNNINLTLSMFPSTAMVSCMSTHLMLPNEIETCRYDIEIKNPV